MKVRTSALLLVYALLLFASAHIRSWNPARRSLGESQRAIQIPLRHANHVATNATVELAYLDLIPENDVSATVVMLHDVPHRGGELLPLAQEIQKAGYRVLAPDLPGFGASTLLVPAYDIATRSAYLNDWLQAMDLPAVHLVTVSHGTPVGIHLAAHNPSLVKSLAMVAPIALQELHLLRDHDMNHALYLTQLGALWLWEEGIPHFGLFDRARYNQAYARTLEENDLRPVTDWLSQLNQPAVVLHPSLDLASPPEAARELTRLLPQVDAPVWLSADRHRAPLSKNREETSVVLDNFFDSVDAGAATTRPTASPERIAAAQKDFDPKRIRGRTLWVIFLMIAIAMQTSEDLTHIGAGLLVAKGIIGFAPAIGACVVGLVAGDLGLYFIGRYFGPAAMRRRPLSWFFDEDRIERFERLFDKNGPRLVFTCRFVPGSRVPVYIAAGMLRMNALRFVSYLTLAACVWSPLLVGVAVLFGQQFLDWYQSHHDTALWGLLGLILGLYILIHHVPALFTWRGRQLWRVRWIRWTQWEYWPPVLFYPPIVFHILKLAFRHRSLSLVTASNPGISTGGLVLETKSEIFHGLGESHPNVVRWALIPAHTRADNRIKEVQQFAEEGPGYPLILKPDVGQRGAGVKAVKNPEDVRAYFKKVTVPVIAQDYVDGEEYGIFYVRRPTEPTGRIISCTRKTMPTLIADGQQTLEHLILQHRPTLGTAFQTLERFHDRLDTVYPEGTRIRVAPVGAHSRGAVFLNAVDDITPELSAAIEDMVRPFEGFYFGRFDLRVPTTADLHAGKNLWVLELNGLTSEAVHIYSPGTPLPTAWKVLREQWSIAFAIAADNRAAGISPTPLMTCANRIFKFLTLPPVMIEEDPENLITLPPKDPS